MHLGNEIDKTFFHENKSIIFVIYKIYFHNKTPQTILFLSGLAIHFFLKITKEYIFKLHEHFLLNMKMFSNEILL